MQCLSPLSGGQAARRVVAKIVNLSTLGDRAARGVSFSVALTWLRCGESHSEHPNDMDVTCGHLWTNLWNRYGQIPVLVGLAAT